MRRNAETIHLALIGCAILAAVALRIGCAGGSLWLDEAWSAVFARDTGTPLGVLLRVNHDNNHHLNTLWLQAVGADAAPLLQRALSIGCGAALAGVAAAIGWRRSPLTATLSAWLFALSPILVTYGSEARGYAPMLLAFGVALWAIDGWLLRPDTRPPARPIAWATGFGMLAQATMAFGLAVLGLWVILRERPRPATLFRLFGPAALVSMALVGAGWWAAHSADGFMVGAASPHDWGGWVDAWFALVAWSLGSVWLFAPLLLAGLMWRGSLATLSAIGIGVLPLAIALLALPNSGVPRYYLVGSVPLLLFAGEAAARGLSHRWWRWLVGTSLAVFAVTSLHAAAALHHNRRGDPGGAVRALIARVPAGTTVLLGHSRDSAVLEIAAAQAGYRIATTVRSCPAPPFLLRDADGATRLPDRAEACGVRYRAIAGARASGLSGLHWTLYARE